MPAFLLRTLGTRFLKHAKLHLRPASVRSYREALEVVSDALGEDFRATHLTNEDVDRFVAKQLQRGVSKGTINVRLRVLKAALRWAVREKLLPQLPVEIRLLRVTRPRGQRAFTREDVARLLSLAKPRERALLAVLAAGGLRIDEALHLRWSDLEDDRLRISAKPELNWTPKSHQEREVYLPEGALRELSAYRATQSHDGNADWMFQGRRAGRRLTTNAKIIRDLFEAAGLYQPGKLCHELRRGAASTWLLAGADLNTVRELLGHASVTTTQLYLRTNEDAKRAAAAKGLL
jgi:integrase